MEGPDVKIRSIVEKEITVHENGHKVTKRVPVPPGKIADSLRLYFTLTVINEGDDLAANVVVDNPIPPGTVYAIGSATGERGTVLCSTDGVFFHPEDEQLSTPTQCTDIRWVIGELAPQTGCVLCFQVIVGRL